MRKIFNDAIFLKENNRPVGCLLGLFCVIDALSKKYFPKEENNKKRYCDYLKTRLFPDGGYSEYRIEEEDKCVSIEEILYKYFRCNFIHEADDRASESYEVQMEYEHPGRFKFGGLTLQDFPNNKFIVSSEKLIPLLIEIIQNDPKFGK